MKRLFMGAVVLAAALGVRAEIQGRYIYIDIQSRAATLSLAEVQVFNGDKNIALGCKARQIATANGGVASRAVDGNTDGEWGKSSVTHTPEDCPNPWWEVELKEMQPISKLVLWNRSGLESRLDNARVLILDDDRQVTWEAVLGRAPGMIELTVKEPAAGPDLGRKIEAVENPNLKPVGNFRRGAMNREAAAAELFNSVAMARAIEAFAKKYPKIYSDKDALLAELKTLDKRANPEAVVAFSEKVFFRNPAFAQFKEMLFIKRRGGAGFPNNWQGNSSIPVSYYDNALMRSPVKPSSEPAQELYKSDAFVGDVALDFTAEKVAFSTRKLNTAITPDQTNAYKRAGWCVAEMHLDKPGVVKEITPTDQPDIDYYDPMYLPNGRMFLIGSSGFQGVPCVSGSDYVGNLLLRYEDGRIRRLSYDQDNNWYPVMLPNGRCLYLRWEYADSAHYFSRVLMTMNPDGTDQQEYYGSNSYWPNSLFYARPLPGSSTKFMGVVSGHHGVARKGRLYLFDVEKGRREVDGVVQELPGYGKKVTLQFGRNQKTLPPETETEKPTRIFDTLANDAPQFFLHPFPISDDMALVAMQDSKIGGNFFLALVDIYDNQYPIALDNSYNLLQPVPLKKPEKPAPIPDRVVEGKTTCTINLVSVYNGPGLRGVPKGVAKKFRVFYYEYSPRNIGGHYTIGMEGPWDPRVLLGTVDIEEDGSCMFEAPANVPIALQPIDSEGKKLQEMRSWLVGMPGENLSCVGCHEQQNYASPNTRTIAARKKPQQIKEWYGPMRGFDFNREVQVVLDRNCVGCHDGNPEKKTRMGDPLPDFRYQEGRGRSRAYEALHPYVRRNGPEGDYHLLNPREFHPDTSEIVRLLEKGHKNVKLSAEDWDRLNTWIDLNVPYYGTWTEVPGIKLEVIARRRDMDKSYSNLKLDSERVVAPYKTAEFLAPQPAAPVTETSVPAKVDAVLGPKGASMPLGNGLSIRFVRVPSGEFSMGSTVETPVERPLTRVRIEKPFWMAETEITVAQFKEFKADHDNGVYDMHYKDQVNRGYYMNEVYNTNFPVIRVTWKEAGDFCEWLSKKTGKKVRLPTEAQWEWACRAGTDTPLSFGDFNTDFSKFANLADYTRIELAVTGVDPKPMKNPPRAVDFALRDRRFNDGVLHLADVGQYEANAFGLKDMHGNVAEWTRSAYRPYPYSETDGRNNTEVNEKKVIRGGSWNTRQVDATSTVRWAYPGWVRPFDVGFRVIIEE